MSAARQYSEPATNRTNTSLPDTMHALSAEALRFIPAGRLETLARQWLTHAAMPEDPAHLVALHQYAIALAADVVLCTPSASGATAFDRLARERGSRLTAADQAALTALRRARHRLVLVERTNEGGQWELRDLASHETIRVAHDSVPPGSSGLTFIVRLAPLGDGTHVLAGPPATLDDAALAVASGFIRPGGTTLVNPLRCAEAVYRHVVRHGSIELPGPDTPGGEEEDDAVEERPDRPIIALAKAWSVLAEDVAPDEADLQKVRAMAEPPHVVEALFGATSARDAGRSRLADSFTRIAREMMQTMTLRAAHGSGLGGLEQMPVAIDALLAQHRLRPAVRALFDSLRAGIRVAPASQPAHNDAELEKLVQRIRALRAKTVAQGCTEAEALSAAEKVAELLDRHGLSVSELDLRRQRCEGIGIATDRRRRAPIDDCIPTIAAFFDCRVWGETSPVGTLHYVFFGLPGDVQAADYLYDRVEQAFATETARFQHGTFYQETHSSERRSATNSFQIGLARGISGKLHSLREARETVLRDGTGRELVPIKAAIVEAELAKLGLKFSARTRNTPRSVMSDAFHAGHEAGQRFDYHPALTQANAA